MERSVLPMREGVSSAKNGSGVEASLELEV